jgi:hypothetical protein
MAAPVVVSPDDKENELEILCLALLRTKKPDLIERFRGEAATLVLDPEVGDDVKVWARGILADFAGG